MFAQTMKVLLNIEHQLLAVAEAKAVHFDLGIFKRRAIDVFEGRYELTPLAARRGAARTQLRYTALIGLRLPPPPAVGSVAVRQNLAAQLDAVAQEVARRSRAAPRATAAGRPSMRRACSRAGVRRHRLHRHQPGATPAARGLARCAPAAATARCSRRATGPASSWSRPTRCGPSRCRPRWPASTSPTTWCTRWRPGATSAARPAGGRELRRGGGAAGVRRIVYLGGLIPADADSEHLVSRRDTGERLRAGRCR